MIGGFIGRGLAAVPDSGGRLASETLPWLGVFAAGAVLLWLVAAWLKRRVTGGSDGSATGFDPEALERLRREGSLSEAQIRAISRAEARRAAGLLEDGQDSPRSRGPDTVTGTGTPADFDRDSEIASRREPSG